MRRLLAAMLGTALLATTPVAAKPRMSPEAELADALKGRTAEEPVDCVNLSRVRSVRIIDRTAILYDAGRVIYVNRPHSGAESLDAHDTLVTRQISSRLCRPDIVRLYSSGTQFETGAVLLGDFVPYRRVPRSRGKCPKGAVSV
jgi:hypothetical protein